MIILVGESASGKSSIEKDLVKRHGFEKIVTYTTRPQREGEVDGQDYHFITNEMFDCMLNECKFAETAEYNGWKYGTNKDDLKENGVIVLTPSGLRKFKRLQESDKFNFNIKSFYIKVPRRDRLIRMLKRGDNIEESYRRNLSDVGQFDGIEDEVDCIITNNKNEKNVEAIAVTISQIYKLGNVYISTSKNPINLELHLGQKYISKPEIVNITHDNLIKHITAMSTTDFILKNMNINKTLKFIIEPQFQYVDYDDFEEYCSKHRNEINDDYIFIDGNQYYEDSDEAFQMFYQTHRKYILYFTLDKK